jgi:PST family polysaccharide transporter
MSIREAAMRGGSYLVARQAASMAIHLTGVLILTRTIGPKSYGIYATALGIYTVLYIACQSGINVYLIRREGDLTPEHKHQAFSLLLAVGIVVSTLAFLSVPLLQAWTRIDGFAPIARALFALLPFQLLALVPSALLERSLDYRTVSRCEVTGQFLFYVVALPLAFRGAAEWAPTAGAWTQQVSVLAMLSRSARYRPRVQWDRRLAREILTYGWTYSSAIWTWQLRDLVNPLVVSRYAGAAAVGYVALAVRLVDSLSFVKTIGWRLSIPILAPLQGNSQKLVRAVSEGMRLQVLGLGLILAAFGLIAPTVMRELFGEQWVFVAQLYPFIALGYLTNALFNLHISALCLVNRVRGVLLFNAVHLAVFYTAAMLFVPRLGAIGYGWSEIAALSSYAILYAYMARHVGAPTFGVTAVWWAGSATALFGMRLGWWALLGPLVALAWPGTIREFRRYAISFAGLLHAR